MANKPKRDSLGDRMKERYEDRNRYFLPRRTYTIIRVDGRAFHTWTRGLDKPYDSQFMVCMDAAALALCKDIAGAKLAYVQSDEISVLLTDFEKNDTEAWFDGNLQKIVSVSASVATVAFNLKLMELKGSSSEDEITITKRTPNAVFDSRAFTIADRIEVMNYFVWRQKDAERNSVTLLASAYASHKQLHGKSAAARQDIIHAAGDNWNNHPTSFKRGRVVCKSLSHGGFVSQWEVDANTPVFTRDRVYLEKLVPVIWQEDLIQT
jgi:tRNA(His) guanylyltransferase